MSADNKRNLKYFEAPSMGQLYSAMETWQAENRKRFLSMSIQRDKDLFCCIALTNPSEVMIVDGYTDVPGDAGARVVDNALKVTAG